MGTDEGDEPTLYSEGMSVQSVDSDPLEYTEFMALTKHLEAGGHAVEQHRQPDEPVETEFESWSTRSSRVEKITHA